jgi:hypothetical protein
MELAEVTRERERSSERSAIGATQARVILVSSSSSTPRKRVTL